jgi:hypothetical protein
VVRKPVTPPPLAAASSTAAIWMSLGMSTIFRLDDHALDGLTRVTALRDIDRHTSSSAVNAASLTHHNRWRGRKR